MIDWKKRLFEESHELRTRMLHLKVFIGSSTFDDLPKVDKLLLKRQLSHMESYNSVLNERIARLAITEAG